MKKILISATLSMLALGSVAQVNSPSADGYCERGLLMYRDGNYVGCVDQLISFKQRLPEGADAEQADFYIAMASARLGRPEALSMLRHFIWRYPASPLCPEALMTIGEIDMDAGRYQRALQSLTTIEPSQFDRDNRDRLDYDLAYCFIKEERYDEALPLLARLDSTKAYGNRARFFRGYIAYNRHNYAEAEKLLSSVNTSRSPENMADFYLSQIYYSDGRYDKALSTANRLRNSSSGIPAEYLTEATRIAGESAWHLGDNSRSVRLLDEYLSQTDSPRPSALYILGLDAYRNGNYTRALEYLSPVADEDSAMGQSAALYAGQSLMHQGDYSTASLMLRKAMKAGFNDQVRETAFYNYAVAQTRGARQPFGNTVGVLEEFLDEYPSSQYADEVRRYIVVGYMNDDNYPAALSFIEKIKNPDERILRAKQHVLYTLGSRQLTAGQSARAVQTLQQARELGRYDRRIANETDLWLAEALYAEGRYAEAVDSYNAYLRNTAKSAENRPTAVYGLGYAYFNNGDYQQAIETFGDFIADRNVSDKLNLADAYNRTADSYFMLSQFDSANRAYADAIATNPAVGDYSLFQQSVIKYQKGNYSGQIDDLNAMLDRYPSSSLRPTALLNLARAYGLKSSYDRSLATYGSLVDSYPETEQGRIARLEMARVYLNMGRQDDAIALYKEIITSYPTSREGIEASESLGNLLTENGRFDEYENFVKSIPGARNIDDADQDKLFFSSARNEYSLHGTTASLAAYLERFPNGAYRPEALILLMRSASEPEGIIAYAAEIVDSYPGNEYFVEALQAKADAEYSIGKGETALESYRRLEAASSDAATVNAARIGIIRSARELNLDETVAEAAENILASASAAAEQRSEATFALALAASNGGDPDRAVSLWQQLARNPDDLFGTRALVYIAQTEFDRGNLDQASETVDKLFAASSPHTYWVARAYIIKSDIFNARGNRSIAERMLLDLRDNYSGREADIFRMIEERLAAPKQ